MKPMHEVLMSAILDLAEFLEFCPDYEVPLDVASAQLESLAATLDDLEEEDRQTIAQYLRRRIEEEKQGENRAQYIDFLHSFLETMED